MPKRSNGWFRAYRLTQQNIERVVGEEPGVYVLGNFDPEQKFQAKKISSGFDVKSALREAMGQFQGFTYKPFRHQWQDDSPQLALF